MTPTLRTFAAICGLTFASDRRALDYLLRKDNHR